VRMVPAMKTSPQQRFAINLRRVRTKAGVSQEELARRCDLHRTEVSLLERAGREPRLGTITKLASSLGTTPQVLCEGITWSVERARYEIAEAEPVPLRKAG
jgi:transcriptional regulator with XRE-family HTH domain